MYIMVKSKTRKHNKKYNTNTRKNNKFRHTKKIYKKQQHTTRKHKKIQHGGDLYEQPRPVDTRSPDYIVKQELLSQFEKDFNKRYPNQAIPSRIYDKLKKHANGPTMTLADFDTNLREIKREWGSLPTNTKEEEGTSTSKPVSTYMFPWLYNLSTSTLIMIRDEINRMLVNK